MARVAGVDLPPNKRAQIGLTYIYGIGRSRATSILQQAKVNVDTRIRELNEAATYTIPIGICFFSFLRKTFFFPPAVAFAIRYFFPGAFFLAIVARRGPLRVRALVCVR